MTVLSVVVAAGVGVATNVVTDRWQWQWGAALVVGVALLAVVHVMLPESGEGGSRRAEGPGSVTVSGDRSVGTVSGGTVVMGDGNTVGQTGAVGEGGVVAPKEGSR